MSSSMVAVSSGLTEPQGAPERESAAGQEPSRSNPASKVGLAILAVVVALICWYPAADRSAPYASGASVNAMVTQIAPRVSGPVTEVFVEDNATVAAGQPLFSIDRSTFEMDVAQAEAQIAQVRQTLAASSAATAAAVSQLERAQIALSTAEQNWTRSESLLERGLLSPAAASDAQAALQNAQAATEAARADVDRLAAQAGPEGPSNPQLKAAEITLEKARFALENTVVVAPKEGHITNLMLAEGQFASSGQPAMTFIDPTTQTIIGDFRENQLVNVQPGDRVEVVFEAAPGRLFAGYVDSIAWGISSGRTSVNGLAQSSTDTRWFPPARKIPVRVKLDPNQNVPTQLRMGSEASVLIYADGEGGFVGTLSHIFLRISAWVSGLN